MAKVLVIDDNEGILDAMKALLEMDGHDAELIQNAGQAFDILKGGYHPDIILLDVLLSGEDGRDICKRLKKESSTAEIPIVMISAHPNAEEEVMKSGANGFVAKPFQINDILVKVNQFVDRT